MERVLTVRELREIMGMSQEKFGIAYGGIPARTIQNWEGGQNKCPDYLLSLLNRCVWEDYESDNGTVPTFGIYSTEQNVTYDLHLCDSDNLDDAIMKAQNFSRDFPVELVYNKEYLSGSYDPIEF